MELRSKIILSLKKKLGFFSQNRVSSQYFVPLSSKSQFDQTKEHTLPLGAARIKPSARFILRIDYRIHDVS